MLPKQVTSYAQLRREGVTDERIVAMSGLMKLFPTPFKGIYYVPLEEERKGAFIEKPQAALTQAIAIFLKGAPFYYSCSTAESRFGLSWAPPGLVHVVNSKLSRRIDLSSRIRRNERRKSGRAAKVARILSLYGREIIFHRTSDISRAKVAETPYGRFALKSQIRADKKRFRER